MIWRNMKLFLTTTATVIVVSQVIKKVYSSWSEKRRARRKSESSQEIEIKTEIRDLLLCKTGSSIDIDGGIIGTKPDLHCPKDKKLISYIRSTKETIDICMFLVTSKELADHIIRLGRKQVLVRVIIDDDTAVTSSAQINRFKEYSFIRVQHSNDPSLFQHKFCVVDGPNAVKRKCRLILNAKKQQKDLKPPNYAEKTNAMKPFIPFIMTKSLDGTCPGLMDKNDNVIITSQPLIVHKFEKEFSRLWHETEYS